MKNQLINLDFTSFYVSSAPSAEGDFFFLERERGGFFVVADETSSPPDCSAAFSGVFDEGFFLVLFFSGAIGVAKGTSSFLDSFSEGIGSPSGLLTIRLNWYSILENVLLKTMFDVPSLENISEVIVDVSSVRGESQPIIVHSKNKQDKDKSKTSAA